VTISCSSPSGHLHLSSAYDTLPILNIFLLFVGEDVVVKHVSLIHIYSLGEKNHIFGGENLTGG